MQPLQATDASRSLAATESGRPVRIHRILFGGLRALCAELGLSEGDTVMRVHDDGGVVVETTDGRRIELNPEWARFIQVSIPGADSAPGWQAVIAG